MGRCLVSYGCRTFGPGLRGTCRRRLRAPLGGSLVLFTLSVICQVAGWVVIVATFAVTDDDGLLGAIVDAGGALRRAGGDGACLPEPEGVPIAKHNENGNLGVWQGCAGYCYTGRSEWKGASALAKLQYDVGILRMHCIGAAQEDVQHGRQAAGHAMPCYAPDPDRGVTLLAFGQGDETGAYACATLCIKVTYYACLLAAWQSLPRTYRAEMSPICSKSFPQLPSSGFASSCLSICLACKYRCGREAALQQHARVSPDCCRPSPCNNHENVTECTPSGCYSH